MSLIRVWKLFLKEIAMGPRNPFFLYAVIVPIGLTFLLQMAFGTIFEPVPRLGIVDYGVSEIKESFAQEEGIELHVLNDAEELKKQVENDDLDAGMILQSGLDEKLRTGEKPQLDYFMGGESLASNRIILTVMALDIFREIKGDDSPVTLDVVSLGEEGLPVSMRLVPLIVFYALVMAGVFLPGSGIVEEKEKGTLQALLVTPARKEEILLAKGMLGVVLSSLTAIITLFLNNVFGPRPWEVVVVVLVAAVLSSILGLLVGIISKNSTALFAVIKGAGLILFAPVVFYIFPEWPQWIARIFPLYWIIEPIWEVSVMGNPLAEVWFELTVALFIVIALIPVIVILSNRMLKA